MSITPYAFQSQAFEEAKTKNIIVVGNTGTGKTHISIMLMEYMIQKSLEIEPEYASCKLRKKIIFVVDKVLLGNQQFEVIEKDMAKQDITVGKYVGGRVFTRDPQEKKLDVTKQNEQYYFTPTAQRWRKELEETDILVMTAQILLDALRLAFIKMDEDIMLLIFDECHHCTKDHPYNGIMKEVYFTDYDEHSIRPKIFGMTA
jgi:ERCC4-related helicase